MATYDPRNKLATAHMVLYSLVHDRVIDKFSMETGSKEIDDFIAFLIRNDTHPVVFKIIDLLKPAQKIIEIHLNGNSSLREIIEVAFADFNKAIDMIGDVLERRLLIEEDNY
jgi:CO dehydrogenase/acetyl-CoA synthase beta subunit